MFSSPCPLCLRGEYSFGCGIGHDGILGVTARDSTDFDELDSTDFGSEARLDCLRLGGSGSKRAHRSQARRELIEVRLEESSSKSVESSSPKSEAGRLV